MKTIKELVLSVKNGNKKAFDKLYKLTSNDVWFNLRFFAQRRRKRKRHNAGNLHHRILKT